MAQAKKSKKSAQTGRDAHGNPIPLRSMGDKGLDFSDRAGSQRRGEVSRGSMGEEHKAARKPRHK